SQAEGCDATGDLNKDLRARLGATKLLLQQAPASLQAAASEVHANALRSSASSATAARSSTEASHLLALAAQMGFAASDLAAAVESLNAAAKKGRKKKRKLTQDFRAVFGYFTEAERGAMSNQGGRPLEVREVCFNRVAALGARAPSEAAQRMLSARLILRTEDMRARFSQAKKIQTFDALKSAWKARARTAQNSVEIIGASPPPPSQHEGKRPAIFARAYADGALPVSSNTDTAMIKNDGRYIQF
ncbi:unnamed protein product, partial [Prorocentrum cordatum]